MWGQNREEYKSTVKELIPIGKIHLKYTWFFLGKIVNEISIKEYWKNLGYLVEQ